MLPAKVRILVCTTPQDMRKSFDTLAAVTQQCLGESPLSGDLYVFVAKRRTHIKILWWDKNGFCLLAKRLHRALFELPRDGGEQAGVQIDGKALAELLAGVPRAENRRSLLT